MLSSKCVVCISEKLRFTKEQEASGLLRSLGRKIEILSKIPVLGHIFFCRYEVTSQQQQCKWWWW